MIKKIILSLFVTAFIVACSSDDSDSGGNTDDFNRQSMLVNWADNIIIPAFQALNSNLTTLVNDKDAFVATPDQASLDALRGSWLEAYRTWQFVEMFNIGKAEEINYAFQMNVYPTNVADIRNNIDSGNYDLANVNNNDAVGFPALDYMLYGIANDDMSILNAYTTDVNFEANKTYLTDLVDQMKSLTETVFK